MKKLCALALMIIFFFSFVCSAFAQRRHSTFEQMLHSFLYSEVHLVPHDSLATVSYSFRIPYSRFVFFKTEKGYSAGYRVSLEVTDSLSNYVTRQTEDKEISTENFNETLSTDVYSQGNINFNVKAGIYHLLPIITWLNSNRDIRMHPIIVDARRKGKAGYLKPIVVDENKINCEGKELFELTNFNNFIPFTEKSYSLIIPAADTALRSIRVVISSGKDTLYNKNINKYFDAGISFAQCKDEVVLENNTAAKFLRRNFIVNGFSQKLPEGAYVVYIFENKKIKPAIHFPLMVEWINKPFSLRNPKKAISYLKDFENNFTVDSLLSTDANSYAKTLFNFWKRYDPTPETAYNPLMNEFYSRIDFAEKNYSTLSGKNGAATDRGKIYIKYGKPKKIERASNQYGKMVEEWIYEKPYRVFEFVEKDGTGNYILQKS